LANLIEARAVRMNVDGAEQRIKLGLRRPTPTVVTLLLD
jgi:hypothetical protein